MATTKPARGTAGAQKRFCAIQSPPARTTNKNCTASVASAIHPPRLRSAKGAATASSTPVMGAFTTSQLARYFLKMSKCQPSLAFT